MYFLFDANLWFLDPKNIISPNGLAALGFSIWTSSQPSNIEDYQINDVDDDDDDDYETAMLPWGKIKFSVNGDCQFYFLPPREEICFDAGSISDNPFWLLAASSFAAPKM